jgi:long-subunit fatty acid transport protein
MRKLSFFLAVIVTVLVLTSSLFAAGVSITDVGARATALGGSYRAIAKDWSAMFWNPAGLTQITGLHVGFASEVLWPVAEYKPAAWKGMNFSVTRQTGTKNEFQTFVIPSGGIVSSLSEKLTIGLGAWAPFGLGAKWDLLDTRNYNSHYPEFDFENDLKLVDIHPTVAFKLNDMISIGAGVGLVYADIMIRQPIFYPNPYLGADVYSDDETSLDVYTIAGTRLKDSLEVKGGLASNFNHIIANSDLTGSGFGFSTNLGVMIKINDRLQIGLTGRYYGDVNLEGTIDASVYYPSNPEAQALLEKTWGDTTSLTYLFLEAAQELGEITEDEKKAVINAYSGGSSRVYMNSKTKATLPLPADIGIGLSYKAINKEDHHLIVSADFQYSFCSVWKVIYIDIDDQKAANKLVENWNDSYRIGTGIEYKMNPIWTLRGSFFHETNAAVTETLTPTIPDANPRHTVNLGFQVNLMPNLALHGSYKRMFIRTRAFDQWAYNGETYDNLPGTYKMSVNNIMFGMDYNF